MTSGHLLLLAAQWFLSPRGINFDRFMRSMLIFQIEELDRQSLGGMIPKIIEFYYLSFAATEFKIFESDIWDERIS